MSFLFDNKKNISPKFNALLKWLVMILSAAAVGVICGIVGGAFARSISFVTELRAEYKWVIFLLPLGGLASAALYKFSKAEGIGTDRVLESATGAAKMPVWLMPVVFTASVITHLFGGSAGKEGAALQMGGSVAELVSKVVKADVKLRSVLTVCGMAGLFSAAFGTPVGACIFALEVAVIGEINAIAILPAVIASVISYFISTALGVHPESFDVGYIPGIGIAVLIKAVVISLAVSIVAGVFCCMLRGGKKLAGQVLKNPFIRIFAGGCIVIALTMIFGTDYNGGGMFVVERIFEEGTVRPEAFLLKIVFTVITISAGYKGGEIVPSFFIGATLGAVLATVFGLPLGLGAAIGMVAFFASVTNCQIAAAVIAVELFGANGFIYFALAAFTARVFFRKTGLYSKQIIN